MVKFIKLSIRDNFETNGTVPQTDSSVGVYVDPVEKEAIL
jgi:hypothetical protein